MHFDQRDLERWMGLIRSHPDGIDCFWPSQIDAKTWIADTVKSNQWAWDFDSRIGYPKSCVIFGCWYGVLADMLKIEDTVCVDLEERHLEWCAQKYTTWGGCMSKYTYLHDPDLVINTVTEHVNQDIYDKWFDNIPEGTHYIIQGNNDSALKDHIRSTADLDEFAVKNKLTNYIMLEERPYKGPWDFKNGKPNYLNRFMGIGKKVNSREQHFPGIGKKENGKKSERK